MFKLLTIDYDARLKSSCALAKCDYEWFLAATGGAERNLEIQRAIIKGSKAYQTLRADLKRGCLLPPVVLAVKDLDLPSGIFHQANEGSLDEQGFMAMEAALGIVAAQDIYIIDGLQRTNAIKQTLGELRGSSEEAAFLRRPLRVEIWINIPFGALAYRMLLLNAGQRPMSIKHQVEILSMKLQEELAEIHGLEILSSIESERRTRAGQFHLAKLSQAFQVWLQGSPNLDLRNLVMEQLLVESAIETLGSSLAGERDARERDEFKSFIEWVVRVDSVLPADFNFLANETVLQGIAAAVGAAERNAALRGRMKRCLVAIEEGLRQSADFLALENFETLRKGIDPEKVNVGQATRDMVFKAFQEYFVSDGLKSMGECWSFAAGTI